MRQKTETTLSLKNADKQPSYKVGFDIGANIVRAPCYTEHIGKSSSVARVEQMEHLTCRIDKKQPLGQC